MTATISAGAAAGLLVALMVVATSSDSHGAEIIAVQPAAASFVHPGEARGFNPQPDPPREIVRIQAPDLSSAFPGDGSVRPASQ